MKKSLMGKLSMEILKVAILAALALAYLVPMAVAADKVINHRPGDATKINVWVTSSEPVASVYWVLSIPRSLKVSIEPVDGVGSLSCRARSTNCSVSGLPTTFPFGGPVAVYTITTPANIAGNEHVVEMLSATAGVTIESGVRVMTSPNGVSNNAAPSTGNVIFKIQRSPSSWQARAARWFIATITGGED